MNGLSEQPNIWFLCLQSVFLQTYPSHLYQTVPILFFFLNNLFHTSPGRFFCPPFLGSSQSSTGLSLQNQGGLPYPENIVPTAAWISLHWPQDGTTDNLSFSHPSQPPRHFHLPGLSLPNGQTIFSSIQLVGASLGNLFGLLTVLQIGHTLTLGVLRQLPITTAEGGQLPHH